MRMTRCPQCSEEAKPSWRLCPVCQTSLVGDERDLGMVRDLPPSVALQGCYDQSWAVIIGIDEYQHVEQLGCAVNDAAAVSQAVTEFGFTEGNIFTLLNGDATKQSIQDLLSVEIVKRAGPNDRVLVFFAGHGQDYTTAQGIKRGYLIPVDGDSERLASRGIAMHEIENWAELLPAKHALFLMDCCYSGLAATRMAGMDPARQDFLAEVTRRPVRQIITAGRGDERVIEEGGQGVFTKLLLRGMRGDADLAGRGFVTGLDLGHYLTSRVHEESGYRQQPLFRYLSGDGEFLFVRSSQSCAGPVEGAESMARAGREGSAGEPSGMIQGPPEPIAMRPPSDQVGQCTPAFPAPSDQDQAPAPMEAHAQDPEVGFPSEEPADERGETPSSSEGRCADCDESREALQDAAAGLETLMMLGGIIREDDERDIHKTKDGDRQ